MINEQKSGNVAFITLKDIIAGGLGRGGSSIAVCMGNERINYEELDRRSTLLCYHIINSAAYTEIIGISAARCIDTIVGIIAILKAGKAYLPLDLSYPQERLIVMVKEAQLLHCLCHEGEEERFRQAGVKTIRYESSAVSAPAKFPPASSLVYVLFTSGSTGKPKGVSMGYDALENLLQWQAENSMADAQSTTLQFAPLGFDVSFQEIFATLTTGGTLQLIDEQTIIDPQALLRFIIDKQINRLFLPFVALQFLAEAVSASQNIPVSLQEIMTAGEQLKITPQIIYLFKHLHDAVLYNQYGPTECHVVTQLKLEGDPEQWDPLPSIGYHISNTSSYILDFSLKPVKQGEEGELALAGVCLAKGYLHRKDLTDAKFIDTFLPDKGKVRLYMTGDITKKDKDGSLIYLGRRDEQVKISGYRVEPGEVELVINKYGGVKQAVVVAVGKENRPKRLVAYLVAPDTQLHKLKAAIAKQLPPYMLPSAYVFLEELPKTSSGKVDKKKLPAPSIQRPESNVVYAAPTNDKEKLLADIWADILQWDKVGINDNLFEAGVNSLAAVNFINQLATQHQLSLPITKLYQYPTIAGIAKYVDVMQLSKPTPPSKAENNASIALDSDENGADNELNNNIEPFEHEGTQKHDRYPDSHDVAIIGMAGRFPGANSVDELWHVLAEGRSTIRFFSDEELDESISEATKRNPSYIKARGVVHDVMHFDPAFFGINPKLAELMDPQHRLFLEITWEALEEAGYAHSSQSRIGVFAGCGYNTYNLNNVSKHPDKVDAIGDFQVMSANDKDYLPLRTAYSLNLKGPAISINAACATSLLAIAQAVGAIRSGQCDVAIAGATSVTCPVNSGYWHQEGSILSGDGYCKPFDAQAQGTIFSDGGGVVLLKNKQKAIEDGDNILALVKGVGISNDGGEKSSFSAPSADGQAAAIRQAITDAGIAPNTISYVEAHGTATPIGDPIEIEGLQIAFGETQRKQYCAIGSMKSNLGHLTAAAGVAGVIKIILSLKHGQIPPTFGYKTPNPYIDFANSPFYVTGRMQAWEAKEQPRRAGVSSFGIGGANVHAIIEEYKAPSEAKQETTAQPGFRLLCWSGKTAKAADSYGGLLAEYAVKNPSVSLEQLSYHLLHYKQHFAYRRIAIADSVLGAGKIWETQTGVYSNMLKETPGGIIFVFPGQGAQYLQMGIELYEHEPVFREAMDECADILETYLQEDILSILFAPEITYENEIILKNTRYSQPTLFAFCYALAKLWIHWGIVPTAFIGHSVGEFVAAHLAGVFTLYDALMLVANRGMLMSQMPEGAMLSVRSSAQQIKAVLPANLSISAVNSPNLCVVAGSFEATEAFQKKLTEEGIACRALATSHAFHTPMMDAAVEPFHAILKKVAIKAPQLPIISTVTGELLTDEQATDPLYWAKHLRDTVQFSAAIQYANAQYGYVYLEVGPANVTATLAKQHPGTKVAIASLERKAEGDVSQYVSLLKALGQLWLYGVDISCLEQKRHTPLRGLPTYPFDKTLCFVKPIHGDSHATVNAQAPYSILQVAQIINGDSPLPAETVADKPIDKRSFIIHKIFKIIEDASGMALGEDAIHAQFTEVGLDSLLLTQIAISLKKEFNTPITFRQINEQYSSAEQLTAYLLEVLPAGYFEKALSAPQPAAPASTVGGGAKSANRFKQLSTEEQAELKKPFGAAPRIEKVTASLTDVQKQFIQKLIEAYNHKTKGSKAYTQKHRKQMSDPRVVSGFKPAIKEMIYPLVVNKSKGSRLWDIDGNEYIDVLNGFGSSMLGYQPDFVLQAVKQQLDKGYELGPQHELAGEVCGLICELTNSERSALCNTGSEAVLGAMRIARTVTGRSLIVAFSGSYHGINDEVLIRGTKSLQSFPAAAGIMPEAVQNMLILDYGTPEALRIIEERKEEIAAVMVEPVQSRRPEFLPIGFLQNLRALTQQSGSLLIFDEVITGFRMHVGGMQAILNIQADLATYGKVVAAGMPIGVIAGKATYMDALDGGYWEYGNDSRPEVGVTYFAGTFVRHPLALASAKAALGYLKQRGNALQQSINMLTAQMAEKMNEICEDLQLPLYIARYGSLWKIKSSEEVYLGELLFTLMRLKGIHIWDGFPCFLTEAHTPAEVNKVLEKFYESIVELQKAGIFVTHSQGENTDPHYWNARIPPIAGAKIGKDINGNPAWFVPNPEKAGKYLQLS